MGLAPGSDTSSIALATDSESRAGRPLMILCSRGKPLSGERIASWIHEGMGLFLSTIFVFWNGKFMLQPGNAALGLPF